MAYVGKQMGPTDKFEVFSNVVELVWIPSSFQVCGHIAIKIGVLNQGVSQTLYFHVPGISGQMGITKFFGAYTTPYFMNESDFQRYLEEAKINKKRVVRMPQTLNLEDKKRISSNLNNLLGRKWLYGPYRSNCQTFVERVVETSSAAIKDDTDRDCPAYDLNVPELYGELQKSDWAKFVFAIMGR